MERMTALELRRLQAGKDTAHESKYGAQRETVDGITFDSKREAQRWRELQLLQRAGKIRDLKRQVPLELEGRDGPLLTRTGRTMRLTLDFSYFDVALGFTVYEDAKGYPTRDYEVRRAVAAAQGVEVKEV